ncbi:MAG: zinc ABC transporter substrate-binding protein [Bacteroidales bacterium]
MRKNKVWFFISIISFIAIGISMVSCLQNENGIKKPVISVSILPQKYFVEKISGENFIVNVLIPSGASPASYEPSPLQIKQLEGSAMYLKNGELGFEKTWISNLEKKLTNIGFYNTSEGIDLLEGGSHSHGSHQHAVDPHVWISPKNVKVIAKNIYLAITSFDPENAEFYKSNLKTFENELDSLDNIIKEKLKSCTHRHFIIYHPALSYFARDYGLVQVPLEMEGKEPGFQHMQQIVDMAKEDNIRLILIQREFNMDEAKTLESEINGKIVVINPLDYEWSQQLLYITDQFVHL